MKKLLICALPLLFCGCIIPPQLKQADVENAFINSFNLCAPTMAEYIGNSQKHAIESARFSGQVTMRLPQLEITTENIISPTDLRGSFMFSASETDFDYSGVFPSIPAPKKSSNHLGLVLIFIGIAFLLGLCFKWLVRFVRRIRKAPPN